MPRSVILKTDRDPYSPSGDATEQGSSVLDLGEAVRYRTTVLFVHATQKVSLNERDDDLQRRGGCDTD
jgi:hypothetical protein